jgi:hypothetical protein
MSIEVDHVLPIKDGGDLLGELRPMHRVCHQQRHRRKPVHLHAKQWFAR